MKSKKKSISLIVKILKFTIFILSGGIDIPRVRGQRWNSEGRKKSLGAVLESYDKKEICDFPEQLGIKFDIKTKRYKSIEMMFQKRISDQINLASDDIFD